MSEQTPADVLGLLAEARRLMHPRRGDLCSAECLGQCEDCRLIARVDAALRARVAQPGEAPAAKLRSPGWHGYRAGTPEAPLADEPGEAQAADPFAAIDALAPSLPVSGEAPAAGDNAAQRASVLARSIAATAIKRSPGGNIDVNGGGRGMTFDSTGRHLESDIEWMRSIVAALIDKGIAMHAPASPPDRGGLVAESTEGMRVASWRARGWQVITESNPHRPLSERWSCEVLDGSEQHALPRGLGYVCGYGATEPDAVMDAEWKLMSEVPTSPAPDAGQAGAEPMAWAAYPPASKWDEYDYRIFADAESARQHAESDVEGVEDGEVVPLFPAPTPTPRREER